MKFLSSTTYHQIGTTHSYIQTESDKLPTKLRFEKTFSDRFKTGTELFVAFSRPDSTSKLFQTTAFIVPKYRHTYYGDTGGPKKKLIYFAFNSDYSKLHVAMWDKCPKSVSDKLVVLYQYAKGMKNDSTQTSDSSVF